MPPFVYQRGETISLALDALTGDPAGVTAVTAAMKAVPPGRTSVPADTPVAATFVVSPRAAAGDVPAGWTLTINAAASAELVAGAYLADARLVVGGAVIITEQVAIRIRDAVTS
jgi:hypothetical protein